jgi:septum formation protein
LTQAEPPELILASASTGRAALLRAAGVQFDVIPASLDEEAIKQGAAAEGLPVEQTALLLAELKARRVSQRFASAIVIGADQILECEGRLFDKPADLSVARSHLRALRGRRHRLVTAVVCLRGGATIWTHLATPMLTMRAFSDAWLESYLASAGNDLLGSVGAYRVEGAGLQCFSAIDGEHSAIIGLPMLPLLQFLRQHGVMAS